MPPLRNADVAPLLAAIANRIQASELTVDNAHLRIDVAFLITDFVEKQGDRFIDLYQDNLDFIVKE